MGLRVQDLGLACKIGLGQLKNNGESRGKAADNDMNNALMKSRFV